MFVFRTLLSLIVILISFIGSIGAIENFSSYSYDEQLLGYDGIMAPLTRVDLTISGVKFHDLDGNGFLDEGEPELSGWTINLLQDEEVISSTTTDSEGRYTFENLYPGSYVVTEKQKDGWSITAPGSGSYEITLTDTDGQRYDFGNYEGDIASLPLPRDYPAMRPTLEERRRWIEEYDRAPLAELDAKIPVVLGSYSLLSQIEYTPSERNQGACGDCWAWAGTGVMEVALNSQEGTKDRLSVQYLNSNYNGGSGINWACCGGWLADLADFYSYTGKAIPWSNANAHWQDGSRTCGSGSTSVPAGAISTTPYYTIGSIDDIRATERSLSKEENIAYIKNVLNQGKAVCFCFFVPNSQEWNGFTSFWSTGTEDGSVWDPSFLPGTAWVEGEGVGHAVLCVGYDDSDPNNRYWIMLNSWGAPSNRPNGLFRMEMDMDYDCYFYDSSDGNNYYSFYWQTLDISYDAIAGNSFWNIYVSFASHNYPNRYIRHSGFLGEISEISSDIDKQDATFKIVPGLANGNYISFESFNFPGYYIRHQGFRLKLSQVAEDQLSKEDATFKIVPGLYDRFGVSFESYNYPGLYIKHSGFKLYTNEINTELARKDATFWIVPSKYSTFY